MFDGPDLRVVLEVVANKAIDEARRLSDESLLHDSAGECVDRIMATLDIDPPILHSDQREVTERGSGSGIELHLPFTGTPGLFHNQPNFFVESGPPPGEIVGGEIVLRLGSPDPGAITRADEWTAKVQQYLDHVRSDVEIWRDGLRHELRGVIANRRQAAEKHREGLRNLAIPIRRRSHAPRTFIAPGIVRRRPSTPEPAGQAAGEPEPALPDDYYDHILFVIRAAGKAMERSPGTYEGWDEPDRRQVLVLMLNTHYAGKVTAEAFNGAGKTDILIREQDKNVFIGECKFYGGPKAVTETVEQLFGYATWRDVKLAIIFFVQRTDFTAAVTRIRDTVAESTQFRRWLRVADEHETEFRAEMAWPGDDQRLVTLHVSAFHTPRPAVDDDASHDEGDEA